MWSHRIIAYDYIFNIYKCSHKGLAIFRQTILSGKLQSEFPLASPKHPFLKRNKKTQSPPQHKKGGYA